MTVRFSKAICSVSLLRHVYSRHISRKTLDLDAEESFVYNSCVASRDTDSHSVCLEKMCLHRGLIRPCYVSRLMFARDWVLGHAARTLRLLCEKCLCVPRMFLVMSVDE
ncbi:hypothetical protein Tco_0475411 [Tanacetum coccineum]